MFLETESWGARNGEEAGSGAAFNLIVGGTYELPVARDRERRMVK